ncbi:hypothetical protein G9A89_007526 [Geosiphon pyriformis]|nr:hypothetical protein G9A89_007526 [Geosiphon pyriformis]
MAVKDYETWASKDQFRTLLFILPIGTTAHDLGTLLEETSEKTYIINHLLNSGNRIYCAVVGFESENAMESAYYIEPIFGGVKLSWTRLDLVCYERCEFLGYSALEYGAPLASAPKPSKVVRKVTSEEYHLWLAKLYAKKTVPISYPVVFVVSLVFPSSGFYFNFGFGSDSPPSGSLGIKKSMPVISDIVHKLNNVELVSLVSVIQVVLLAAFVSMLASLNIDMVLDVPWLSLPLSSLVLEDKVVDLGLSSSKVFTFKVGGLESKMMALKVFIGSILKKLDLLYINLSSLMYSLHQ